MLLENPRRQVSLVLLLTLVSLYLIFRQEFNLGPDLSGGTELIYEIDVDAARREGLVSADTPTPELIRQTISIIQDRIDPTGTIEASVTQRGETGILIEIPKMTKVDAEATIRRIETLGSLEMRVVARDDYNKSGVKFELNQEKERLRAWLDKKTPDDKATYRELIAKDPGKVRTFNQLNRDEGGRLSEHLRWYPRLIERSQKNPDAWDYAMSEDPTGHVVAVFAPDQRARPPQGENPFLVELVPINIHERKFTGEDLDPAGVKRGFNEVGQPSVDYVIKGEVMDAYADLSEEYIGKQSAIILNGIVKSAPVYRSRIPGRGQISGGFTTAEADELVKVLKTGSLQVRPDLMAKNTIGPGLGERSIELGMQSMLFGGLAVLAFMIWYYRTSGLVAVIC
ncbi:MAG: hypothetical protein IT458_01695, partial [Planctomycetes bacterium]|nr:hypothetical protein [Planctomycetota bacterium]